jgi:hypothetical protein
MVRDYETPTVPPAWETFARRWAEPLGLGGKRISLICSPDRYGNALVLRLIRDDGDVAIATRRSSDADDAATRRRNFLSAVQSGNFQTVELDAAGYFVGEGSVPCTICGGAHPHEEWQHAVLRELLRVARPPAEPPGGLSPEEADDAEQAALDRRVAELLTG